ncbi:immunoglobulin-binding protein 1 [Tiliqua scincoides]|uniref:immunoglobulin-binding protein 1 n=1 Tax=Tiliqua scincoides TaxID=71010 RepID=UPI0034625163
MAEEAEERALRPAELLEGGWRLLEEAEAGAEPSGVAVQRKVQRGVRLLERAARAAAELQLFSRGEDLEEVPSADLRFMLVPALLAAMLLKLSTGKCEERLERLERARASFLSFLTVCRDYGLGRFQLPPEPRRAQPQEEEGEAGGSSVESTHSEQAALLAMAQNRQNKIERYKQKKEIENRLAALKATMDSGQAEEEQTREFYLLQIKKWIGTSLEEIESIDQEMAILNRRDALKKGPGRRQLHPTRPPMKPFILTRDAAQAKVFGAGYPSLATMTVDDWYEQHQKQGILPDQGIPQRHTATVEEQQKEQADEKVEAGEDSEEATRKAREWDDWKDTHPRGYGNRKNMG